MKLFFTIISFLVFSSAIEGSTSELQDAVKGRPIKRKGRSQLPTVSIRAPTAFCTSSAKLQKRYCNGDLNDACSATGFVFCTSATDGITMTCPDNLPFCVEDTDGQARCLDVSDGCENRAAQDVVCLNEGVIPDAANCRRYYYCFNDGTGVLKADAYECPDLYAYDPSLPEDTPCRLTNNRKDLCITVNCPNSFNSMLMNYPTLPRSLGQVGVTCMGTGKPIAFRCKKDFLANLNSFPVDCEIQCRSGLRAPFPRDNQKYYDCYYDGRIWRSREVKCFRNYYFNKSSLKCEASPITTTEAPEDTDEGSG